MHLFSIYFADPRNVFVFNTEVVKHAMDMKLLERRLLMRDSTLSSSSVSKCASRLQQYLSSASSEDAEVESTKKLRDALVRELTSYRLEMSQAIQAAEMCERELEESLATEKEIEENINKAEIDINGLSKELNEQKSIRRHKEECELLARLVNSLPPQSVVGRDISKAEDTLRHLRDQSHSAEYRVNMRTKQFQGLLQSIFDMKSSLQEESEQQEILGSVDNTASPEDEDAGPGADSDVEDNDEETEGRRGRNDDGPALKKSRTEDTVDEEDEHTVSAEMDTTESQRKDDDSRDVVEGDNTLVKAEEQMEIDG